VYYLALKLVVKLPEGSDGISVNGRVERLDNLPEEFRLQNLLVGFFEDGGEILEVAWESHNHRLDSFTFWSEALNQIFQAKLGNQSRCVVETHRVICFLVNYG